MSNGKVYTILVLVMLAWGLNVTWLKIIVSNGDPLTLQSFRILTAGIVVFLILIILRQKLYVENMPWKYIILGSLFGVIFHHGFLAFGIEQTTATKTAIISGFSPLMVAIIAVIFKDTILTKSKLIGFILGGLGVFIAVVQDFRELLHWQIGDILVFLSFFLQAFSFIAIRRGTKMISPLLMTAYMLTIGSLFIVCSSILLNPKGIVVFATGDLIFWSVFLLSAVIATGLGHSLYNLCIKNIGTAESAIFVNLNTVFALIGTTLILSESISLQQIIGTLIIIVGVLVGTGNVEVMILKYREKYTSQSRS